MVKSGGHRLAENFLENQSEGIAISWTSAMFDFGPAFQTFAARVRANEESPASESG